MIGIQLSLLAMRRDAQVLQSPTAKERHFLDELNHLQNEETGYQPIQGTKQR